jgi:hypothetical protein
MVDKHLRIIRLLAGFGLVAAGLLGPSGASAAVTATADSAAGLAPAAEVDGGDASLSLRPEAAVRARADVQIRRVKTLMLTKPESVDAAIAALEKLREALAGRH